MTERIEVMWCTRCGARFTQDEIKGWGCPKCGDQGVPCGCDDDLTVEVNWHELRILGIWAENWARHSARNAAPDGGGPNGADMPLVVAAITRRLQRQYPKLPALTLSQEIAELPAKLTEAGIEHGGMETNVERPQPVPINGPGAVGHARPKE